MITKQVALAVEARGGIELLEDIVQVRVQFLKLKIYQFQSPLCAVLIFCEPGAASPHTNWCSRPVRGRPDRAAETGCRDNCHAGSSKYSVGLQRSSDFEQ